MGQKDCNSTLAALRAFVKEYGGNAIGIHVERKLDAPSWSDECVFLLRGSKKVRGVTIHGEVKVRGIVRNGTTSEVERYTYDGREEERYVNAFRPPKGFWYLYTGSDNLRSAVSSLPMTCEPFFEVYLDANTNQYLVKARLHGDALYLHGKGADGDTVKRFLLDTATGAHNSARFGVSA